jgi:hypothetical protein
MIDDEDNDAAVVTARDEHAQAPPPDRRFAIVSSDDVRLAHGSFESLRCLLPVIREHSEDRTRIVRLAFRRRR